MATAAQGNVVLLSLAYARFTMVDDFERHGQAFKGGSITLGSALVFYFFCFYGA